MAHRMEPMDIDSDFDNKENSLHHNNVLPFTEKGYEELDVSELNMKLRYSITPASSPMSKSYTANCLDNRSLEAGDDSFNVTVNENSNLTRSLNATLTVNDNVIKSLKALPLQALPTEQFVDSNRNTSVLRPLDTTVTQDNANITVTVSGPSDIDETLSLLSSSSSTVQTPEALTPTKDITKNDGGSPIMRGLKSVLNMFRSSQSPIPPTDSEDNMKPEILSPTEASLTIDEAKSQAIIASTPISTHRKKETSPTKRNSPYKDSVVFNDDLEKELQWKDETTIIFSQERIPIHKLFFQQPQIEKKSTNKVVELPEQDIQDDMNSTVEYMDISYNESITDRTMTDIQIMGNKSDCTITGESDGEFVDCETTFTKNESLIEDKDKTPVNDKTLDLDLTKYIENTNENTSASRLKQIILDTTQDILDATLSITPEDLLPEALEKTNDISSKALLSEKTELNIPSEIQLEKVIESTHTMISGENQENSVTSQENLPVLTQTVDIISPSVEIQKEEDPNITRTIENYIQPVLDQTIEITSSLANAEYKEDSNVTNTIGNIPAETLISENQPVVENDSTLNSETIVLDGKIIEDQVGTVSIYNNAAYMISDTTLDIEFDKTGLDASHTIEYNSFNSDVASTCPGTIDVIPVEDVINKPLPILNDKVEPSPVKEVSMTELAADIPLPDEDDLEKELSVHVDISTDASTAPNSLPLDLVDDIKLASEIHEIKHNVPLEETEVKLEENGNDDKNILEEVLASNTQNVEGSDNLQTETMFNLKAVQQVIELKNEQLLLTEEPQLATIDVLPESASPLNIVHSKSENKIDQVLDDVEVMNMIETESLNSTVINNTEENDTQNPEVVNESVIEFKPLPDIINQTITNQPNIENCELSTNISETVILEQQVSLSENVLNKLPNHEIVPEVINKPENLSDANVSQIVEPADELTNATQEDLTITPAIEEIIKNPVTNVCETFTTEDVPVLTQTITDAQPNNVDVIPTDTIMLENQKQLLDSHNVSVSESADIKTVDEEIILSENNSPFVSVIAENLQEINPEENFAIQNVDEQLVIAKKVVYTPPASPPIASKGYNFNFDEMDDPFATKTKIRISPPLDTPTKAVEQKDSSKYVEKPIPKREMNNRRKTQSERKRPVAPKRKFNSTFSGAVSEKTAEKPVEPLAIGDINLGSPSNVALDPSNVMIEEDKLIHEARIVHEQTLKVTKAVLESKRESNLEDNIEQHVETPSIRPVESATIPTMDEKTSSSSEYSAYHSVGTSSSESNPTKNVFNLPEIDDMNFNPFATKSKMRQSPTPTVNIENPFATKCKIRISPESSMIIPQNDDTVKVQDITITVLCDDKMETELMEKDASENLNNTTTSSKASDEKNATIREVNTEDEDTIEGPFLEAEDLNTDDKMLDYDGENIDMMQFTDLPTQGNEDNLDNGELFIDAEAFEFLLNQNKSNTVVDSGKESLFLKFDPLFAKRMSSVTSDGVVASLSKMQKRQSTPTKAAKSPQKEVVSPVAGPSNLNITQDMDLNLTEELNDELNVTISKPMMVVPPAVNSVTPRNKSLTPNRSNRRSITFTSPAMAVIDRLLSLSGNSSFVHDTTVAQVTREQNEADFALIQLRELLAEKEVHVYNLRSESNELRDRLITLESHMKSLEVESQQRLKNITDLNDRLSEKTKINKSMAAVVEEYERTIASLISETAQDKKRHAEERIKLINERDEQTAHLASMEVSFTDLHSKYEKSKQVIQHYKANEDNYKKSIKEFEENLTKMQNNYELLKQHATSKLNNANQELEKMNRTHEAEVLKLNAMVKRKDLHITSLEESLAQKTKANEELTAICDELINKVG